MPKNNAINLALDKKIDRLSMKVENLSQKMVTKHHLKNELKKFAKKDDLKNFATKDDLKNFATKDGLEKFATKEALERLTISHLELKQEVREIKEVMATKSDVNRILDRIDFYAKESKWVADEQKLQSIHIREVSDTLNNHEKRLTTLENS